MSFIIIGGGILLISGILGGLFFLILAYIEAWKEKKEAEKREGASHEN